VQAGWSYTGSFYVKSQSWTGPITVSLVSSSSGQVYATTTVQGVSPSWTKLSFKFQPTVSAASTDNVLRFSVDGASARGKTLYFGMFSLFPPTYRNRPNGMRIDLGEALAAIKPGVFRFPGGNNLEGVLFWAFARSLNQPRPIGSSANTRWKWNETVGVLLFIHAVCALMYPLYCRLDRE
jgi:alpha-N-arabinofuranosidase